jgi:hypothetical protein
MARADGRAESGRWGGRGRRPPARSDWSSRSCGGSSGRGKLSRLEGVGRSLGGAAWGWLPLVPTAPRPAPLPRSHRAPRPAQLSTSDGPHAAAVILTLTLSIDDVPPLPGRSVLTLFFSTIVDAPENADVNLSASRRCRRETGGAGQRSGAVAPHAVAPTHERVTAVRSQTAAARIEGSPKRRPHRKDPPPRPPGHTADRRRRPPPGGLHPSRRGSRRPNRVPSGRGRALARWIRGGPPVEAFGLLRAAARKFQERPR